MVEQRTEATITARQSMNRSSWVAVIEVSVALQSNQVAVIKVPMFALGLHRSPVFDHTCPSASVQAAFE